MSEQRIYYIEGGLTTGYKKLVCLRDDGTTITRKNSASHINDVTFFDIDKYGSVYLQGNQNIVRKYFPDLSALLTSWGTAGEVTITDYTPNGVVCDSDGYLYVCNAGGGGDTDTIYKYDRNGNSLSSNDTGVDGSISRLLYDKTNDRLYAASTNNYSNYKVQHSIDTSALTVDFSYERESSLGATGIGSAGYQISVYGTGQLVSAVYPRSTYELAIHTWSYGASSPTSTIGIPSIGQTYVYPAQHNTTVIGNNYYVPQSNSFNILKIDLSTGSYSNITLTDTPDRYGGGSATVYAVGAGQEGNLIVGYYKSENIDIRDPDTGELIRRYDRGFTSNVACYGILSAPVIYPSFPNDFKHTKKLVAIGGTSSSAQVWYGSTPATLASLSDACGDPSELDSSKAMQAFEAYQKVFIANNSVKKVCDFVNTKASITAPAAANIPPKGTILTTAANSVQFLTDYIPTAATTMYGTVLAGTLTAGDVLTNSTYSTNITVSTTVESQPHIYDWGPYATTNSSSYGSMPTKATLACLYRGRAVLAGHPEYPYNWYMSRQGDPWDWAFFANDPQSPVAGNEANAGLIGDNVTCIAPYKDDYMIIGCANEVWVMRGDPAAGGTLDELSLTTGIFGPYAYTWDGEGNFYFLGNNGIWQIPSGLGQPINLTESQIPKFNENLLDGLDQEDHRVVLHYDRYRHGINICVTKLTTGENDNYWYDLRTKGWFPESWPYTHGIYSAVHYEADDPDYKGSYYGTANGYIRYFDDDTKNDDSTAIDSYVTIGPYRLGIDRDREGKLISMSITTAVGTDSISYELYSSETAEQVRDNMSAGSGAYYSGSFSSEGRPYKIRPRTRAAFLGLKLYNSTAGETWATEYVIGQVVPAGKIQ